MPELPEVEVTRRSFADRIEGARVTGVRLGKPLRWPLGCAPDSWSGRRSARSTRRGKYLWLAARRSGGAAAAPGHVRLAGLRRRRCRRPGTHDHFDLVTDRGTLRLTDPRRFGAVVWSPALDAGPAAKLLARLGVEPFDAALRRRPPSCRAAATARRRSSRRCCRRHRRRRRQHLRLRGAVRGRHRPAHCAATASAAPRAERLLAARARARWRARSSSAARRCATSATPTAWPARSSAGARLRPRRPAVRALRRHVRRIVQGAARDVLLPRLPAPLKRAKRRRACDW